MDNKNGKAYSGEKKSEIDTRGWQRKALTQKDSVVT